MEVAISKYKNRPSLNAIRGKMSKLDNSNFQFEYKSSVLNVLFLTSFLKIVTLILLVMLMIIHRMSVHKTLILSFLNFRKTSREF